MSSPARETQPRWLTTENNSTVTQLAETPLERISTFPEHVADRELTTNQERARFIARDIRDYAEKAPARLLLDSGTIAKVTPPKARSPTPKL